MATTLPAAASKANSDSSADDPKQALLTDLAGIIDRFNDLLDALGAAARLNLSGQFGTVAQAAGTPDDLRLKAPYAAKASSYTALEADIGKVIDFTAAATLAFAAAATLGADWWCEVRNSSAGTVTLDPDASELIDGAPTLTLGGGESCKAVCTGSGFKTVGRSGGKLIQVVNFQTGAQVTGGGLIPIDDTVPQSTEGSQYMELAITPKSAANRLLIEVNFNARQSTGNQYAVALFKDSDAAALAAVVNNNQSATNDIVPTNFTHFMTAGTTSTITFRVRAGGASGVLNFNGGGSGRLMGGVLASSITITEIAL